VKEEKHNESQEKLMTFWSHLDELRGHLIRSAIAVVLMAIITFLNKNIIFDQIILAPKESHFITNRIFYQLAEILSIPALRININPVEIINIEMAGQFMMHILISIIGGIIVSVPYLLFELWRFIQPALKPKEKANSRGAVFITSLLFITGVLFGFFLIVPLAVNFLGSYQVSGLVENQIALRSYITTVTTITLGVGLLFELPILVYFLSKINVLTPNLMRKNRKVAIIIIIALSALITPPDVISQILVGLPILVLYEFSIIISARVYRKNQSLVPVDE